ncbi:MAG: response regulator transcription factor [Deltaproteobacteria bacterium]|nr:MAG: response regulator transcription factor [Deltaproteobacteria bacterium]
MENTSILIVEDDLRLGHLLQEYLSAQGFQITLERRGDRAIPTILEQSPDLVILDIGLPGADGLEVCREVRRDYPGQILMLTARKTDVDQIVGLELGADDYVAKPVEPRLLLARVRTLLRRLNYSTQTQQPKAEVVLEDVEIGDFFVSVPNREVRVGGQRIELTTAEFDLLWYLVSRRGEVVTRQELYLALRGIPYNGLDRVIDIHISRIRRKIRDSGGSTQFLKSIRGTGYLVVERI